jgi:uncharacterized protein with von Willebrand factor type A (vWA) domain
LQKYGYDKLMQRLQEAAEGTEGTPRRRQQMDRHRRHLALRQRRHQSGRHPHRRRRRQAQAVKVWDQRSYRDYDADRELGTRNIKVALRRLRRFARTAPPRNWRWTTRSAPPPTTPAGSTSACSPSARTASRC